MAFQHQDRQHKLGTMSHSALSSALVAKSTAEDATYGDNMRVTKHRCCRRAWPEEELFCKFHSLL